MTFQFYNPEFLWLLLLIPVAIFLKGRSGNRGALMFSSIDIAKKASLKQKTKAGSWAFFLRLIVLTFCILGLARPQAGKEHNEIESSGVDILLAVDVSSSMLALDFSEKNKAITRLDAVKSVLNDFIQKRPYDRMGIVAFAGNPYLVSPLTLNHEWLESNLERLHAGLIEDGTAIGSAIAMGTNRLRNIKAKSKILILLTDGFNNRGNISPIAAAEAASTFNVKIYTVGVGRGGIVPTLYLDPNGELARDVWGKLAIARAEIPIDEDTLRAIAETTGGAFFRARDQAELKKIYNIIDEMEKTEVKIKHFATYHELYPWMAISALAFLALEQILAHTRLRRIP